MSQRIYDLQMDHYLYMCHLDFGTYALRLKWKLLAMGGIQ